MNKLKYYSSAVLILSLAALLAVSCGSKDSMAKQTDPQNYLPEAFSKTTLKRSVEIRTFDRQTLWEYIDGGAEIYYLYDFEAVATADYKDDGTEIVADIYKFNNADNAFGLYSMIRPVDAQLVRLGVEGFIAPGMITFVKGDYVVKLIGFDESAQSSLALTNLAEELSTLIPGRTALPEDFTVFPGADAVETSKKFFAASYLGHRFLTDVYTQQYVMGTDTIGLFLSEDSDGAKFAQWKDVADKTGTLEAVTDSLGFDGEYFFQTTDRYYGPMVIGLKSGYLAGAVGYKSNLAGFVKNWLSGI